MHLIAFIFSYSNSLLPAQNEITGGKKSGGSTTLGAIKILRVFRVLRPLRAINRAKGLKVIVFVFHVFTHMKYTINKLEGKTSLTKFLNIHYQRR